MRDLNKIRCYWYDELGHHIRDCPYFKDQIKAIAAAAQGSDSDKIDDVMMVSDEVSTSSL